MKKKPKEEQLELFAFVHDAMIIQDQIDLFKPAPTDSSGVTDEQIQEFYKKVGNKPVQDNQA